MHQRVVHTSRLDFVLTGVYMYVVSVENHIVDFERNPLPNGIRRFPGPEYLGIGRGCKISFSANMSHCRNTLTVILRLLSKEQTYYTGPVVTIANEVLVVHAGAMNPSVVTRPGAENSGFLNCVCRVVGRL